MSKNKSKNQEQDNFAITHGRIADSKIKDTYCVLIKRTDEMNETLWK